MAGREAITDQELMTGGYASPSIPLALYHPRLILNGVRAREKLWHQSNLIPSISGSQVGVVPSAAEWTADAQSWLPMPGRNRRCPK